MKNDAISQHLEKLSLKVDPANHANLHRFLSGEYWLKNGKDCYFFTDKNSRRLALSLGACDCECITLLHPIENSDWAYCVSVQKITFDYDNAPYHSDDGTFKKTTVSYNISVGRFNLKKTAGNPADLRAVRMEITLLDREAGETEQSIRMTGCYRNYKAMHDCKCAKTTYCRAVQWLINLLPKSDEMLLEEKLITAAEEFLHLGQTFISSPGLNRLRPGQAFNY